MSAAPPLPFGWTEHLSPTGQAYYYNVNTKESTYIRPIPPQVAKKKEKPLTKTPIPGTEWLRVKTTEGNVFYTHKVLKESLWQVPDEIKDAVALLEEREKNGGDDAETSEASRELERVKSEVADAVKRKAAEPIPSGEVVPTKRAKTEKDDSDSEESEGEEEDWEKEAAAQLAVEAEEERQRVEEETKRVKAEAEAEAERLAQLNMPQRVDLSVDEAKALFKTLLREKDINPLHPWDVVLPLFVTDPRYVLLSSYCRERAREIRQANVKKEKEVLTPKEEFERFLKEEVKSTRTSWTEFRRTWKKDRRFYGWGRDDREREKKFREWLKELGEKKRAAAQKAEADFFTLLREKVVADEGLAWKDMKLKLSDDPRYDAVGSSSLREELYNTFLKGVAPAPKEPEIRPIEETTREDQQQSRQERAEQAVKEREQKVRADLGRVEAEIGRSRQIGDKEEGELLFKTMLVDAVRDPQMTWELVVPLLSADPRFQNSPLPLNARVNLFHLHMEHLRAKYFKGLHALFEEHAPTLATTFDSLPLSSLLDAPPVAKLGFNARSLEPEFERWQRERGNEARKAFDEMLSENSFLQFWGQLKKIGGEGVNGGVKADEVDVEEEGDLGSQVDMKALAKNVDAGEVEKVLKNDKRYTMFNHVADQRERWIQTMRWRSLLSLALLSGLVAAQEFADVPKEKHDYQSDVARLRKIVINSLYSHNEIFLRELISNANDALEKFRLTALKDKSIWDGSDPLNVTIQAVKDEDGKGGRIIITDTGIGMSPEELTKNLGTLAKSGTSDFLAQAESGDGTGTGNLIGAFGLGFYSSFLVADRVHVASIPPKTTTTANPVQHIFSSSSDDSSFEIFEDPRGNTLVHGTEITLYLKEDATEYLDNDRLTALVNKHSSYSSTFPIYLFQQKTEEVPDEEEVQAPAEETEDADAKAEEPEDSDEAIVEEETAEVEPVPPKMKTVVTDEWVQLNALPPLWMRSVHALSYFPVSHSIAGTPRTSLMVIHAFPDSAPTEFAVVDYEWFYKSFWKDFENPLAWQHFSGDSESGVSFKSILYIPAKISEEYWKQPLQYKSNDIKLMVKRVFITSDLGEDVLPKWASWVKAVVDAEDLPLNVSRETLQSTRFLRQMKQFIIKRILQLFARIAEDDKEKFEKIVDTYGSVFKLGAVEDTKNREKLTALTRFTTTQRNYTSLDQYLENKKQGQKQIFYLSEMGKSAENLARSVFVEKLHARGYEVLLLNEPLDEIFVQNLRHYKHVDFQTLQRQGCKFGDEETEAQEKEEKKEQEERYQPLLKYLKNHSQDVVRDVVISNRLVSSPCAVVADNYGYTANVERMMSASNAKSSQPSYMHEFAKKAKVLEINPRSPLIEGLLRRVEQLDEEDPDVEIQEELDEVASILIDGALVRSGFEVPDSNSFFTRVDRVLRRSLGVSETAPTDTTVKPAPPVDPELPTEEYVEPPIDYSSQYEDFESQYDQNVNKVGVQLPDHLKDQIQIEMEEIDEDGNVVVHDEL
ncbi:Hsp90 protein-domain-containing protein [Roridomyces roridus]|uniref:Hsp90 protein-domain-containing protein n=1 Tax=Roridomyces roridus TaxID=1738132 RepID=A0AAD7C4W0_9AGAR|nr:Hsp90 protein-domain-containing protein [Roridomyces roridus]